MLQGERETRAVQCDGSISHSAIGAKRCRTILRANQQKVDVSLFLRALPVLLFIAGLALDYQIFYLQHRAEVSRQRDQVALAIDHAHSSLGRELHANISLAQGLIDLVRVQGGMQQDQFDAMARELTSHSTLIRNIALAPGNVIRFIYPREGNEQALGLDYLKTPEQRDGVLQGIAEQRTVVAGPIQLVQGGTAIIGRTPIFLQGTGTLEKTQTYWGMASTVISFDALIREARLDKACTDMRIALRGRNGTGSQGDVFWGDADVLTSSPVTMDIALPSGSWQMAAVPIKGWPAFHPLTSASFLSGLFLSVLLSALLFQVLRITQARAFEIKRRQVAEQRFADIIEFLPDATFVIDPDKRVIAWNRACEVMTGVKKEALLGQGDYAYAEPFFGERHPILIDMLDMPSPELEVFYTDVQRQGIMIDAESYIPRLRGGQGAHLWGVAAPLFDRDGRRSGAIEVIRDITEHKQAEEAQRESERKYRELVEHANSIILRWGRDGRIIFLNEFGQHFFGYSEAEIAGRHVSGTIVPETESDGRSLHARMDEICANPAAFEQNVNENMRRNGERVWIAWTNKVVLDSQGQVSEILSIGVDITARKRAEDELLVIKASLEERVIERTAELAAAKERAESADLVKSAFLATMSHELRTPLNSIIGFTGLLLQGLAGPLNAEQTKQLGMVKGSGQHLLALINDVLDISKIEAGQIEIANAPFDLSESVQKVVQTVTPIADKKHLPLAVRIGPEVGQITSDRRRVEQILLNLLSNAIKFTEHGEVTLTVETEAGIHRLCVADTGIGIKPEDLDKLFQPFRQLDVGLTRQHEGTGLGLAICKRLVDRLGGTISVESHWNKGSLFTFTLPLRPERNS